jgi:cell shape-determining protein MreD
MYLLSFLLFLLIIVESSVTTLPLVLLFLIIFAVFVRSESVFLLAFFAGLLLDILTLRPLGLSSAFFLSCLFLILLYERKFEIGTFYFVAFASFFSSLGYLLLFPSSHVFSQVVICVILSFAFFTLVTRVRTPKLRAY